jgi:hypothetical protein
MKPAPCLAWLLALAGAADADAKACGAGLDTKVRRAVHTDSLTLAFAPRPAPVRVGQHFAIDIEVCAPAAVEAALTAVDAEMPAHRHGMNYRPRIEALGPGRWRASGLMFHMPGHWRYRFDLTLAGNQRLRLAEDVQVD